MTIFSHVSSSPKLESLDNEDLEFNPIIQDTSHGDSPLDTCLIQEESLANDLKYDDDEKDVNKSTESEDSGVGDLTYSTSIKDPYVPKKPQPSKKQIWTFGILFKDKNIRNWRTKYDDFARVGTMAEFWRVFDYLGPASRMDVGCDYSLFRAGIIPAWEDSMNKDGGRWILEIPIKQGKASQGGEPFIDVLWQKTLNMLIDSLWTSDRNIINGACISRRRVFKVAVWLKNARDNLHDVMSVGRLLKEKLGLGTNHVIKFSVHKEEELWVEDKWFWRRLYGHYPEIII